MRKLIDYLPPVMADVPEMQGIMRGEQPYFDVVWEDLDELLTELYVPSATGEGLRRWERLLKLSGGGTAEERRTEILLRMARRLPYTETMLKDYLYSIFGEDVVANVYHDDYAVEVGYTGDQTELFASLYRELRQMVPANMTFEMYEMMALYGQLYTGVVLQIADKIVII